MKVNSILIIIPSLTCYAINVPVVTKMERSGHLSNHPPWKCMLHIADLFTFHVYPRPIRKRANLLLRSEYLVNSYKSLSSLSQLFIHSSESSKYQKITGLFFSFFLVTIDASRLFRKLVKPENNTSRHCRGKQSTFDGSNRCECIFRTLVGKCVL